MQTCYRTEDGSLVFKRCADRPLIAPRDVPPSLPGHEVLGVFNPAAAVHDGEMLLIVRSAERPARDDGRLEIPVYDARRRTFVHAELDPEDGRYDFSDPRVVRERSTGRIVYLTTFSFLKKAVLDQNGQVRVEGEPVICPDLPWEAWGMEDPRLTVLDGRLLLTYSAVSEHGVAVALAASDDGRHFTKTGLIFPPENKNAVLFPRAIDGRYVALHRPVPYGIGMPDVWLAFSPDLVHWGAHRPVFGVRRGWWDAARIGAGAPPIETESGWLLFYHGADDLGRYAMGAVLLDPDRPWEVRARTAEPLLAPEAPYETSGFFGGVVFPTGAVVDPDGVVTVFYGAADESVACARARLDDVLAALR